MSKQRSGLLSGLIVGFIAALICTAGVGATYLYYDRLPETIKVANGTPLGIGVFVLTGLIVGLAVRLVRPRSRLLPPISGLLAAAAIVIGVIAGLATRSYPEPSLNALLDRFDEAALMSFLAPIEFSWTSWLFLALAAVIAFLLVAMRVRRLRAAQVEPSAPLEPEPEYRDPFEPATPSDADPRTTGELFTPRNSREA